MLCRLVSGDIRPLTGAVMLRPVRSRELRIRSTHIGSYGVRKQSFRFRACRTLEWLLPARPRALAGKARRASGTAEAVQQKASQKDKRPNGYAQRSDRYRGSGPLSEAHQSADRGEVAGHRSAHPPQPESNPTEPEDHVDDRLPPVSFQVASVCSRACPAPLFQRPARGPGGSARLQRHRGELVIAAGMSYS
jgi:hypothetical protein